MTGAPHEILDFWFGDALASPAAAASRALLWFRRDDGFDREIARRFGSLPDRAARGELDAWRGEAPTALALILVLDQFPRNLHRGSARAFEFDPRAREVAMEAIAQGFDAELHPLQAGFFYLPLEHAEDAALQERCVALFEALEARAPEALRPNLALSTEYARRHRDVIRRFGRFPHRNPVLGREASAAEIAWLESGGDTFA